MIGHLVDSKRTRSEARARPSRSLSPLNTRFLSLCLLFMVCLSPQLLVSTRGNAKSVERVTVRRVNAPYDVPFVESAIFWFGSVTPTQNYADVRVGYDDAHLYLQISAIDRRLWYDTSPSPADLADWDAVTIYLNKAGNTGYSPGVSAYRFEAQLVWWEPRQAYQGVYRGDGNDWITATIPFTTTSSWRGDAPNNDVNDRGWSLVFIIPFTSLEMGGPPNHGTVWGLAVALHDADDAGNTPIADQVWPETIDSQQPATWGQLAFGVPKYGTPPIIPAGTTTIRHGLDGSVVMDADVGGSSACGALAAPDYFATWGSLNYAGKDFLNIQNVEIGDWPCYSKYYVTFPLDLVPAGQTIISATLTLYLWGGAGEGWEPGPQPSLIQVFTIDTDWDEATLTWNNAPFARENIAATMVEPVESYPGRPGIPYHWDVSRAVAEAYASGSPLRLAMYEADWAYHSGKYFDTSDTDEWSAAGRPTLQVSWGVHLPYSFYVPYVVRATE